MSVAQPAGAITTVSGTFADAIFSSDGSQLYAVSGNTVKVIDVATGSVVTQYTVGYNLGGMDLSPDGQHLAVVERNASTTAHVYEIDLTSGAISTYSLAASSGSGS